ncbi:aminotransferase [Roseibium polysiphoniae]|uniref:aminotransferase n=1 Tax=Roseibium polysiphoniae TaxID=2571221 RepID=UPI002592E678|nr:aminotransferase [uncultured Roseibium sp.]
MNSLNTNLLDTATPPIPEAQVWLDGYDGRLGPVVSLSQAVPGDAPPQAFLDRISDAARTPDATRYGDIFGDMALRSAYASDISSTYGADLRPGNTAITAGCNQAFFVTMMALAKSGEAILLPAPWYFNHKMTLDMLGIEARPLPLSHEAGFVPDPAVAADLIDENVRAIVLVTPNNPTGAMYPAGVIDAFHKLCADKGIWLVVDETYRDFISKKMPPHRLFTSENWQETVISLYSFSKAYAIPGHRLGAIVASGEVISQIGKILDCVQICPARAAQMALPWAIDNLRQWRSAALETIMQRIAAFSETMSRADGWEIDQIGAYFAYVRHPFEGVASTQVAEALARQCGVLALPGSYFGPGQERHLRVAFANVGVEAIADLGQRFDALTATAPFAKAHA